MGAWLVGWLVGLGACRGSRLGVSPFACSHTHMTHTHMTHTQGRPELCKALGARVATGGELGEGGFATVVRVGPVKGFPREMAVKVVVSL